MINILRRILLILLLPIIGVFSIIIVAIITPIAYTITGRADPYLVPIFNKFNEIINYVNPDSYESKNKRNR